MAGFVADQIASDAIITAKILNDAVTTAKIVDDAVTTAKILNDNITTAKILDANVTEGKLATGAVTTAKLGADAVTNAKVADGAIDTEHLAGDCIDGTKVADLAIDTEHLAASAVETAKINALAVTTAKIAADAVDDTKIADNAIGNEHLQDNCVTTTEIAATTILDANINASASIALTKLATLPMTVDGTTTVTANIPMNSKKFTGLVDGTTDTQDSCTVKQMETHVSTALVGNEWQESVIDRFDPVSATPAGPSTGDRYISTTTNNGWTTNYIYEYNGSTWDETVMDSTNTGTFVSVDDETGVLYYWGGSSWVTKTFEATTASLGLETSGLDVRIAASAAGDGITLTTGVLSVDANTETGSSVAAVNVSANGIGMAVDESTIEHTSNTLRVKADGIGTNELGGLTSAGYMYISNGSSEAIAALTKVQETTQDGTGNWAASAATVTIAAATGFYGPIQVFYNGQYWEEGASGDYEISGNVITLHTSVSYGLPFEVIGMAY
jgi:hypothetical protein